MQKPEVCLEAWQIWPLDSERFVLLGLATSHPRLPGRRLPIRTSQVVGFDPDANWAETLNTRYRLGRPVTQWTDAPDGPSVIALAGLLAERTPGTNRWRLSSGDQPIDSFDEPDVYCVLGRMLDREPVLAIPTAAASREGLPRSA